MKGNQSDGWKISILPIRILGQSLEKIQSGNFSPVKGHLVIDLSQKYAGKKEAQIMFVVIEVL